jgi:hypothetical protein
MQGTAGAFEGAVLALPENPVQEEWCWNAEGGTRRARGWDNGDDERPAGSKHRRWRKSYYGGLRDYS